MVVTAAKEIENSIAKRNLIAFATLTATGDFNGRKLPSFTLIWEKNKSNATLVRNATFSAVSCGAAPN